ALPVWHPPQLLPQPALAVPLSDSSVSQHPFASEPLERSSSSLAAPAPFRIGGNWNRLGLFDLAAVGVITWVFIRLWVYAIERM
ncbi:MAG TPA: hypothetical protein VK961_26145, partial [Chthoniobacter sp.]|nr:hypothetical protein [Chthoniobacter sp.]